MLNINKDCKDPKWCVTGNCCGKPFYWLHKNLLESFCNLSKLYRKYHKYGNWSFRLDEVSTVAFHNKQLADHLKEGNQSE